MICKMQFGCELTLADHIDILHTQRHKCELCGIELHHIQALKLHHVLHHYQQKLSDGTHYFECKLAKQLMTDSIHMRENTLGCMQL